MSEGQETQATMDLGAPPIRERILNRMKESGLFKLDGYGNVVEDGAPRPDQPLFMRDHTKPTAPCNEGCYGLDSLDRVELAMAIEDEFDLEISDAEVNELDTLEDIESYLAGRGVA